MLESRLELELVLRVGGLLVRMMWISNDGPAQEFIEAEASGRNRYKHVTELWRGVKCCIRSSHWSTSRGKVQTGRRQEKQLGERCAVLLIRETHVSLGLLPRFVSSQQRTKTNQLLQCGQTWRLNDLATVWQPPPPCVSSVPSYSAHLNDFHGEQLGEMGDCSCLTVTLLEYKRANFSLVSVEPAHNHNVWFSLMINVQWVIAYTFSFSLWIAFPPFQMFEGSIRTNSNWQYKFSTMFILCMCLYSLQTFIHTLHPKKTPKCETIP